MAALQALSPVAFAQEKAGNYLRKANKWYPHFVYKQCLASAAEWLRLLGLMIESMNYQERADFRLEVALLLNELDGASQLHDFASAVARLEELEKQLAAT